DWHVEPEHPVPGEATDDRAADYWPQRDGEPTDAAPDAKYHPAPSLWHRGRQNGQRQRHHDRATNTLKRPSNVQRHDRRRQRRPRRRWGEDRDADRQRPPTAETNAQRSPDQQQ